MVPEHLRSRQSAEVTLKSGLKVGIELPNARDLVFAGDLAWPVLERIGEIEKKALDRAKQDQEPGDGLTDEERHDYAAFERLVVARMIRSLPDEEGKLQPATVGEGELSFLTDPEFSELRAYAMRLKALPGKAKRSRAA